MSTTESGSLPRHIPQLDGIRGLACLFVLIHHYFTGMADAGPAGGSSIAEKLIAPFMLSGVDLFFVLSGFLIGGILIDHRGARPYFSTFYLRRICRIFPVYYLLVLSFFVILASGLPAHFPAETNWLFGHAYNFWNYASFTQNFAMGEGGQSGAKWLGITWSLAVEEQFYLLFPLIVWFTPRRWLALIAIAGVAAAPAFRHVIGHHSWFAAYALLPCRMDTLMCGVLAALAARSPRVTGWIRRSPAIFYGAVVALAALLTLDSLGIVVMRNLSYSFLAWMYGLLILLVVVRPQDAPARLMTLRPLVLLGLISYAVYMYHQAVNGLMHGFVFHAAPSVATPAQVWLSAGSMVLTIAIASLSQMALERPIRRWGKRFHYGRKPDYSASSTASPNPVAP